MLLKQGLHRRQLPRQVGVEWVQRVIIERQGDAAISQLRQEDDGVFEFYRRQAEKRQAEQRVLGRAVRVTRIGS